MLRQDKINGQAKECNLGHILEMNRPILNVMSVCELLEFVSTLQFYLFISKNIQYPVDKTECVQ